MFGRADVDVATPSSHESRIERLEAEMRLLHTKVTYLESRLVDRGGIARLAPDEWDARVERAEGDVAQRVAPAPAQVASAAPATAPATALFAAAPELPEPSQPAEELSDPVEAEPPAEDIGSAAPAVPAAAAEVTSAPWPPAEPVGAAPAVDPAASASATLLDDILAESDPEPASPPPAGDDDLFSPARPRADPSGDTPLGNLLEPVSSGSLFGAPAGGSLFGGDGDGDDDDPLFAK